LTLATNETNGKEKSSLDILCLFQLISSSLTQIKRDRAGREVIEADKHGDRNQGKRWTVRDLYALPGGTFCPIRKSKERTKKR